MTSLYETIKIINGYAIRRMKGVRGFYSVYVTDNQFYTFRTIKSASQFCESLQKGAN